MRGCKTGTCRGWSVTSPMCIIRGRLRTCTSSRARLSCVPLRASSWSPCVRVGSRSCVQCDAAMVSRRRALVGVKGCWWCWWLGCTRRSFVSLVRIGCLWVAIEVGARWVARCSNAWWMRWNAELQRERNKETRGAEGLRAPRAATFPFPLRLGRGTVTSSLTPATPSL
jgi:hypothetical protein